MLFFHFLRKTSQLLPERNAGKLPHYYYFSNVGLEPVHKKNTYTNKEYAKLRYFA